MIRKTALVVLALGIIVSAAQAAPENSERFELHLEEDISLGNFEFQYEVQQIGGEKTLQVGEDQGDSMMILNYLEGEEIYERIGKRVSVNQNLSYRIEDVGSDSEGEYLDIQIYSMENIFASAELSSNSPDLVFVSRGETLTVPLELENTGLVNQTFNLSAEIVGNSSGITGSFVYQDFNISRLRVPGGESRSIDGKIQVPETVPKGIRNVTLVAEGNTRVTESLEVSIRESQEEKEARLEMNIDEQYTRINPGEDIITSVRIRNSGEKSVNDMQLSVESPSGWETDIRPREYGSLSQYDSARFTVTVSAPQGVTQGDYFLEFSGAGEEVSIGEPQQLRINVREKSRLQYVGIFIMVLSLGTLGAVYKKFGRR